MSLVTITLFIVGLGLLAGGGELLVRSATRLASDLGVSRLFIGLTVVAFGTSAPEAVVSVMAAWSGSGELALGNVVGSNILNVLLILGLSALIAPLAVAVRVVRVDIPIMVALSLLVLLLGLDGQVARWEGVLLLALLVVHIAYSYRSGRRAGASEAGAPLVPAAPEGLPRAAPAWRARAVTLLVLCASLGMLVIGSRWLIGAAVELARWLGLSELVIGLTVVALGTSLPELATSLIAARRGERDIAVGNVIGSNVFNILGVLGLAAALVPAGVAVPPAALAFDLPVMLAAAALCLPIAFTGLTIARWEGGLLVGYFVLYLAFLILRSPHEGGAGALATLSAGVGWVVLPATFAALALTVGRELRRRWMLTRRSGRRSG